MNYWKIHLNMIFPLFSFCTGIRPPRHSLNPHFSFFAIQIRNNLKKTLKSGLLFEFRHTATVVFSLIIICVCYIYFGKASAIIFRLNAITPIEPLLESIAKKSPWPPPPYNIGVACAVEQKSRNEITKMRRFFIIHPLYLKCIEVCGSLHYFTIISIKEWEHYLKKWESVTSQIYHLITLDV